MLYSPLILQLTLTLFYMMFYLLLLAVWRRLAFFCLFLILFFNFAVDMRLS